MSVDPVLGWIARAALVLLFTAAALHKARDPEGFAATLAGYRMLPPSWTRGAAGGLVAVEAALAASLALPGLYPWNGLAAAALLALYSGAIALNLARGRRDIDCGCLGPGRRQPLSGWLLARNGLLGGAALLLAVPSSARPLHPADAVTAAGALTILVLLWHAAHRLGETGPALRRSP